MPPGDPIGASKDERAFLKMQQDKLDALAASEQPAIEAGWLRPHIVLICNKVRRHPRVLLP